MSGCDTIRSFTASEDDVAYSQQDGQNITPQPRSIGALHIQPPITIRKITAPPTLPGQAPREGFQAVSPRGDGLPPGLKAMPIYSPAHTTVLRLHRSVASNQGSLYYKALRRTVQWVKARTAEAAGTVSQKQLLETAAIQPMRGPLQQDIREGLESGILLRGPLRAVLRAPLGLFKAAASAVRGTAPKPGLEYTSLPVEAAMVMPASFALRPSLTQRGAESDSHSAPATADAIDKLWEFSLA